MIIFVSSEHPLLSLGYTDVVVSLADNWLLRADQRTLVLTDFGACIDSSAPPKAGSPCLSRPSAVARPASDARAKTAAAAKGGSKAASLPYPSSMCGPTAAVPHTASVTAASSINRSTAVVPSAISPSAAWSPYRSAGAKNPAAPAPTAAATAAQVTSGTRREQPTGVGGLLPLSARSRRAGGAFSELFAARSPAPASAFDAAMGQATARFATSVAEATARRKRPRVDDGPPPATEVSSGFGADESEDRGRKRPRGCDGQGGGDGGQAYRGPAVSKEEPKACSLPANSEKLVFPFSSYCATGTPGFLAPEVARAWRKKEVLDFRRSDVSVYLGGRGVHDGFDWRWAGLCAAPCYAEIATWGAVAVSERRLFRHVRGTSLAVKVLGSVVVTVDGKLTNPNRASA